MRLKKGFTLLEILLVIALIGILASIIIVAINPTRQLAQARNFQRQGHIKTINDAVSQYIVKTGETPEGVTGWYKDICPVGGGSNCVDLNVLIPDYLSEIPTEPDGTPYQIALNSTTNKLSLRSGEAELGADISINPLSPVATFVKQLVSEGVVDVRSTKHLADGTFMVYGGYWNTFTLGEGEVNETTLPNEGDLDMFLAKYNPDGSLIWAKRAGGLGQEDINHVAVGVDGSVVIGGRFGSSITFRPGEVNPIILTGTGSFDIFLAKYDKDGNLLWAESVAGSPGFFNEYVSSIEIMSDGTTVVSGDFEGTVTFGAGESNQTVLVSAGNTEAFVAKYSSNGTLAWAKRAGGSQYDSSRDMIINQDGSIIVTGVMSATATFGAGEANQTLLVSAGSWDIYIAKYAANGSLVWAKRAGSLGSLDSPSYIDKSTNGSFIVTGIIDGTATFGPGEPNQTILTRSSSLVISNTFIAKYNADGTLSWAKQGSSSNPTDYSSNQVKGLSIANNGNITIAGEFSFNLTFAEGESNEVTLTSTGDNNLFITQYNPNGDLVWAKQAGSIDYDTVYGFDSFSDGSIIITGLFGENMVFGPGEPNSVSMNSLVGDTYIAKYNVDGSVDWAKRILNTESFSVSSSPDGSSVLVGEMFGNTIFGIDDSNQISLNLIGSYEDMFIAKLNPDGLLE